MKLRTLGAIALGFVLSMLLSSCSSNLSESKASDILYAHWLAVVNDSYATHGVQVTVLSLGKCQLSSNQKAESGADARWVVRYNLDAPNQQGPLLAFSPGEWTSAIERIGGQWVFAPNYRANCSN